MFAPVRLSPVIEFDTHIHVRMFIKHRRNGHE